VTIRQNAPILATPVRALACAALACSSATAATVSEPPVYRCGDSYSSQRCGNAPPLDLADPRTAAERAQGLDVARRERRLADELTAERKAREAAPPILSKQPWPPCPAAGPGPCTPKRSRARHARAAASAASGTWIARVPTTPKAGDR
jgi:hypothetical protein